MKRHFVLDENVIVLAYRLENDRGEPDASCLELIREINVRCHSLVVSDSVWHLYSRQVRTLKLQRVAMTAGVLPILASLFQDATKQTRFLGEHELAHIDELADMQHIDEGEALCFRACAAVPGAVLVTTDTPFRTAVETHGLDRAHGVVIQSPDEALETARTEPA